MCPTLLEPSDSLANWDAHSDRLGTIVLILSDLAASSPCQCGECLQCRLLASLVLDASEAKADAIDMCNALARAGTYPKAA